MQKKGLVTKNQPKIDKLIREKSPDNENDSERPRKMAFASVTETVIKKEPTTSKDANDEKDDKKPLKKIMDKNLASIFNPTKIKTKTDLKESDLAKSIKEKRERLFQDISVFRFNKKRVKVLSDAGEILKISGCFILDVSGIKSPG